MSKNNSGIYYIINKVNSKYYIGSTSNFSRRKNEHFNELKKGIHRNSYLQRAFNKYGASNFIFKIIEYCNHDDILIREQWFLDNSDKRETYNLSNKANCASLTGKDNHAFGKPLSQSHKKKISKALKGKNNPMYGKPLTEDHKKNLSKALKGKKSPMNNKPLTREAIRKIREEQGKKFSIDGITYLSLRDAAQTLNISRQTIHCRLKNHSFPNYQYL